ncbi:MAG: hypothetical protein CL759_08710 [Chloroflexi bacterium]|nr:hypothetical protein [Chloroflexota bacterium]
MVKVTALPETVTADGFTSWLAVPVPVTIEDFSVTADAAIEDGTVVFASNVTTRLPPTLISLIPEEPPVTAIVYWDTERALVGSIVTVTAPIAALAGLAWNMPKANIVAIAPMARTTASPKDVPILVFIYSYLLVLCALKRRVFS